MGFKEFFKKDEERRLNKLQKKIDSGKYENKKSFACSFGFHKWAKFVGPQNVGDGKFMQKYKCERCGKVIRKVG